MRFWTTTAARYALAAALAILVSVALSFAVMLIMTAPDDDTPGPGLLFLMALVVLPCVLLPVSLGITAEFIQRKVQSRSFRWLSALRRVLTAMPMMGAPFYLAANVAMYRQDARPHHWQVKEALLCVVSAGSAYLALRIDRRPGPETKKALLS